IQRGSGGLVTALSGLAHQIDLTWIACAQSEEDAEFHHGVVPLEEPGQDTYLQFIQPEANAYEGYYNVIANPLLWFLQHSMWDLPRAPVINQATWQAWENGYIPVNKMFAEAIASQIQRLPQESLIMLQDYHLYLAGRYLRDACTRRCPTVMLFIHIPWPGPEYWGILPATMRQAILDGLCAVDLLGFQTRDDSLNFIRTCESYLPAASVNYKRGRIWYRHHATYIRDFPISIDVDAIKRTAESLEVLSYRTEIDEIKSNRNLILRIDRIEPSKNIIRGFQAFEEMLELHPEHLNRVIFLAYLMPSRLDVEEYQNYLNDLMAAGGRINARFGDREWEPVRIIVGDNYPRAIAAMQSYDVLLVNAIADGMNLVAKEGPILNQANGVLILSERAGARQQLETGATVISPCDVYATAEALHQALVMPESDKEERSHRLRWLIEREDINTWLMDQLDTLEGLNL
ncbi:MAG: alpha,alpha-trehalose-phosphate synthase (UDP-forming), partial [Anaerolineales bacterium]